MENKDYLECRDDLRRRREIRDDPVTEALFQSGRFLTGRDYDHLCERCQAAIDACIEVVLEGPDTDSIEAPFDFAADHGLLCGGSTCAGGFKPGQICHWDGLYYSAVVVLEGFHERGGFWVARDGGGQEVCPSTDDLRVISEKSPIGLRHAAHMMQARVS